MRYVLTEFWPALIGAAILGWILGWLQFRWRRHQISGDQIDQLHGKARDGEVTAEKLTTENTTLQSTVTKLEKRITDVESQRDRAQKDLTVNRQMIQSAETELRGLQSELETTQEKLADTAAELEQSNSQLTAARGSATSWQERAEAAQGRVSEAQRSAEAEVDAAEARAQDARDAADAERELIESERVNLRLRIEQLQVDLSNTQQDNTMLSRAVHEARIRTARLRRPAKDDDLTAIEGIGNTMQAFLHSYGIRRFSQLGALEQDDVDVLQRALKKFPGRIRSQDWVGQAHRLSERNL